MKAIAMGSLNVITTIATVALGLTGCLLQLAISAVVMYVLVVIGAAILGHL